MVGIGVGADWCWGVGDVEGKWWVHGRDRARTEPAVIATVLHTPTLGSRNSVFQSQFSVCQNTSVFQSFLKNAKNWYF